MGFLRSDKLKGYLQLVLVVAFIAFALIVNSALQAKKPELTTKKETKELYVQVIDVKNQNKRLEVSLSGVFKARSEVEIVPQVSGRVINIDESFFKGGVFLKDQILFEIEPEDYILEVNRLQAEVRKAETFYELERAEAKAALSEWYQLHPYRRSAPDLVARKPQIREAVANLRAAQSSLQNAKLDLKRTKFTLPFSGRVVESSVNKGQYLSASQSYGSVYDAYSMEIESAISDSQAAILSESSRDIKVSIEAEYFGKEYKYRGFLKRAFSEYEKDTRFGRVTFAIDGHCSNKLFPGIFAKVNIVGKEIKDVMVLPISALQNGNKIWHVQKGILKKLEAKIIFSGDEEIVIKSKMKNAKVVIGKLSGGFSGMKVKFDEVVSAKK